MASGGVKRQGHVVHCRVAAGFFQTQISQGKGPFPWSQKDLRAGGAHSANTETGVSLCDCVISKTLQA